MRFMLRCAVVIGFSVVVFLVMQMVFDGPHCLDCGQGMASHSPTCKTEPMELTAAFFLIGSLVDFAIAMTVSPFAKWVWRRKFYSK